MNELEFYLQHGYLVDNSPKRTERVEYKEKPLFHHVHSLSYTASGYGAKLPTRYMVKYLGRWYRVYSVCFSNCSTEYILSKGEKIIVTTYNIS